MTIEQWRKGQEDDDFGFRLASLSPRCTGLPVVVWIEVCGGEHVQPRMLFTNYATDGLRPDSYQLLKETTNLLVCVEESDMEIGKEI